MAQSLVGDRYEQVPSLERKAGDQGPREEMTEYGGERTRTFGRPAMKLLES